MGKRRVNLKREESLSSSTSSSSVNVPSSSSAVQAGVRYGECQKNQAASIGGYAVDGCREFMPSGEDGTDAALTCAACGCHRNFHRRLLDTQVLPR